MKRIILAGLVLPLLAACGHHDRHSIPMAALDTDCFAGPRHGPSGVMDWTCIDGDGEDRLRPQPLHRVIRGEEREHERQPIPTARVPF
jgi:hypothetical protein